MISLLKSVLIYVAQWALERLGKWGLAQLKKYEVRSREKDEIDAEVNAIEAIADKIYELEARSTELQTQGKDYEHVELEIKELEERLKVLSGRHVNSPF